MSPSSFEKAIRLQFDCLICKVIDRTVKNHYRELERRAKHEVPFCDVTEPDLNHVATLDEYSMGYTVFPVYGTEVHVYDECLCEAIKALSERQRNIVLMICLLEQNESFRYYQRKIYGGLAK